MDHFGALVVSSRPGLSPWRLGLDPRQVHTRFVMDQWVYQYDSNTAAYILIILEGQTAEGWNSSRNQCCCRNRGPLDRRVLLSTQYGDFISQLYFFTKDTYRLLR
jgi:hypothetical protein